MLLMSLRGWRLRVGFKQLCKQVGIWSIPSLTHSLDKSAILQDNRLPLCMLGYLLLAIN